MALAIFHKQETTFFRLVTNGFLLFVSFVFYVSDELADDDKVFADQSSYLSAERMFLFLLNLGLGGEMFLHYTGFNTTQALNNLIHPSLVIYAWYLSAFMRFDAVYGNNALQIWNVLLMIMLNLQFAFTFVKQQFYNNSPEIQENLPTTNASKEVETLPRDDFVNDDIDLDHRI